MTTSHHALSEEQIVFNRDIRPILSENCFQCHGPDEQQRQAGLRLDKHEGALTTLDSGAAAIVAGDSTQGTLLARVSSADEAERMPPPSTGKSLTAAQVDLLKRWIDQGAAWQGHWSFIKPEKTTPAQMPATAQNAIDAFIQERLAKEGLTPAPEADKTTLIRRLTFDLTGLPPTPAEVDAFLADESVDAYERLVDRLLDSPRYGEHMARYWLDLVRYGDTHGLHLDNERTLWKYREWVIEAFNSNKPFDRFAVEQLAGDLLPNATIDQRIATGFNRCNVTTGEGGSIDEEVLVRYAVDRTETMSTIFLGLTLGCAVCHDHKFDPVSQKEFYQLYAFYNAAADAAMDGNASAPPPILKVPELEQTARMAELDRQIAAANEAIAAEVAKYVYHEPPAPEIVAPAEQTEYVWIEDSPVPGAKLEGASPWEWVSAPEHPVFSGQRSSRLAATGLMQYVLSGASPGLKIGEGDKLFAYVYLDPVNPPKTVMLQWNDGNWEHRAFWGQDLIPFGSGNAPSHLPMGPLPKAGEWVRLEVEAAKVGLNSGATVNGWAFTQHDGVAYWDKGGSVTRTPQDGKAFESQFAWEEYDKALTQSSVPQAVRDAIKVAESRRTVEQQKQIRDYYVEHVHGPAKSIFAPLHAQLAALNKEKSDVDAAIPVTMVMADLPTPRETFILKRGEYDKKGDKVEAGTPAALPPLPADAPRNRLGLANWLVDPAHPLTARVAVNRFWQQLFGRGIVKTAEDFGSQGEWPSHPALLDWLAVDFQESGWNVKGLLKQIVMSRAYKQSSRVSPELLERDPENVLLARGPRFRLDAEVVRDSSLFSSGLLVEDVGGKSVKPYQPGGIWEAVGFVGSNTREFARESGRALYRRSLYTFWKRTAPPPSLMAFDAPSRETCVARRARTNTPLQALVLMNDEQYVEAARKLAERILQEGGAEPKERLKFGFRLVTARWPQPSELEVLTKIWSEQLSHYQENGEAAEKLLAVGESQRAPLAPAEHAAMTMVANLLLNLDEAITKE